MNLTDMGGIEGGETSRILACIKTIDATAAASSGGRISVGPISTQAIGALPEGD